MELKSGSSPDVLMNTVHRQKLDFFVTPYSHYRNFFKQNLIDKCSSKNYLLFCLANVVEYCLHLAYTRVPNGLTLGMDWPLLFRSLVKAMCLLVCKE